MMQGANMKKNTYGVFAVSLTLSAHSWFRQATVTLAPCSSHGVFRLYTWTQQPALV